jgi:ankyrin repeat protein
MGLKCGTAQLEAVSSTGETAIILAACKGRGVTIPLLLTAGANMEAEDMNGSTALLGAAYIRMAKTPLFPP